jgi:hypothetical protein
MGAIVDCICTDCAQQPAPAPIPGTTSGAGTVNTINIYNDFSPLNLDAPVYVYPDGTYSNIPPGGTTLPGTGGGGTLPPPGGTTTPPAEEPPTTTPGGTTTPPATTPPTLESMFPWFILAALGYAGYQVLKEKKPQQKRKKK